MFLKQTSGPIYNDVISTFYIQKIGIFLEFFSSPCSFVNLTQEGLNQGWPTFQGTFINDVIQGSSNL